MSAPIDLTAAELPSPITTRAQLCEMLVRLTPTQVWDLRKEGKWLLKQRAQPQRVQPEVHRPGPGPMHGYPGAPKPKGYEWAG